MLFLISIVLLNLIQLTYQDCQAYHIKEDQLFYSKFSSSIMIESDVDNLKNAEYRINSNLIEKSFTLKLFSPGKVIQSKVLETLDDTQKFQKWLCNLLKSSNYFITYSNLFENNDKNYEQAQTFVVEINSSPGEICEEFFGNKNNSFAVFCYSPTYVIVYAVFFKDNSTQLLYQYNLANLNITQCKRTYLDLQNFQFLLAFHQCENWIIINLTLNQILLNQTILYQINTDHQINQLFDIQYCDQRSKHLVLVEDNFYLYFDFYKSFIYQCKVFQRKIKTLLLNNKCVLQQISTKSDQGEIYIQQSEIITNLNSSYEINYINDRLFFYNENEISLILTLDIKYTIQIPKQQIKFIKSLSYFYQIDEELKQIQFYKYHIIQPFIQPTKQYIYILSIKNLALNIIMCYKIVKVNENDENFCQISSLVQNYCKPSTSSMIQKYVEVNDNYYELYAPKSLEALNNNFNSFDSIYQCKPFFNKLNYTLLAYENASALFLKNNILKFTSCDQKCQDLSINISGMHLISKNDVFWLCKLGVNQARVLRFDHNSCLSMYTQSLEYSPDNITQFGHLMFIFQKDQLPLIYHLISNGRYQLKQQLPENLFLNEDILFYKEDNQQTAIQYSTLFVLYQKDQQSIYYLRIQDVSIINMLRHSFGDELIGIHRSLNILFCYYIQNFEIQLTRNITYKDYTFVRPIVYQFYLNYLILMATKSEQMYLLVLVISIQLEEEIQWISSIKCNSKQCKHFFLQNSLLVYQDENNQMRQSNIKEITLQINNLNSTQSKLVEQQIYPIQVISQITGKSIECQLNLYVENNCHQLQLNYFLENKLVSKDIVLANYFYGPILTASISNNTNLILQGPFLRIQKLLECKFRFELNCLLKIKLLNNQNEVECYFLALDKHIHHVTCQILNSSSNSNNLQIIQISNYQFIQFWKNDNIQHCFYQIFFYDIETGSFVSESSNKLEIMSNNKNPLLVKRLGKLVIFQIGIQQELFYFQFNSLLLIQSQFELNNAINFEDNENLILQMKVVKTAKSFQILFSILQLEGISISILGIITLDYLQLSNLLIPLTPFNEPIQTLDFQTENSFTLLKCKFEQDSIYVQISQLLSQNLLIYQLQFNKLYQLEIGTISKIIRQCDNITNLLYLENQTLICNNFVYDLRLEKQFYDPIHQIIIKQNDKFHLFNTTHLILESMSNSEFFFGKFGYEIEQLKIEKEVEKFNLVAVNDLQTIEVELMLINKIETKGMFIYLILTLIGLLILIAFIVYLIRRQRLKIKIYIRSPF